MMTINAAHRHTAPAQTSGYRSDSDSDDSGDVAFANMDFSGVDFGGGEEAEESPRIDDGSSDLPAKEGGGNEGNDVNGHSLCDTIESSTLDDHIFSTVGNTLDQSNNAKPAESLPNLHLSSSTGHSRTRKAPLSSIVFPSQQIELSDDDKKILSSEKDRLLPRSSADDTPDSSILDEDAHTENKWEKLFLLLENGQYADILRSDIAINIFGNTVDSSDDDTTTMVEQMKMKLLSYFSNETTNSKSVIVRCIELEIIGIASLNLFLQLNYTGPSMDRGIKPEEEGSGMRHPLDGINPHDMFQELASKENEEFQSSSTNSLITSSADLHPISEDGVSTSAKETESSEKVHSLKETNTTDAFHNAVLSELAIDGELPFQVCVAPYFLLLARAILSVLAEPTRPFRLWSENKNSLSSKDGAIADAKLSVGISSVDGANFAAGANHLSGAKLWNARAVVAHRRLISTKRDDDDGQACPTLWNEAEAMFSHFLAAFCDNRVFDDKYRSSYVATEVMLEWGLAQHHMRKLGRGKDSFNKALELSNLQVEVTGAEGKRTKFQQNATAQYLVRAKPLSQSASGPEKDDSSSMVAKANIEKQMIKHDDVSDDAILLEKIQFEEEKDNTHYNLSILDQSVLLALCLDVKNDNPMDGLTGEQMGAYLARVLNQHDDWMIYSTALLERAWLECERTHGRERAILQIQALADQHSNRLTLTQSTFKAVEEDSAPAQDRLRNLHGIVYPPRWDMLRDLAERYAKLGVVTSAAEMFEELELWDEVVECYRIAGKETKAVEVVRARLAEKETPRMYAALGDLTNDPKCFERSLELSNGKFYDAHVALGKYYFEKGDLQRAFTHFLNGLEVKPLMPAVWFRVGTIGMQLKEWDTALRAFTEVVQQEPEEGDAWANVAAIHMHRKNPAEAYPALIESLKQNRNNWRVWVSKLYTCIDLKKYDEAIQTCTEILSLKARKNESDGIPMPEEKCVRAIVGGALQNYHDAHSASDEVALDSSKRTLARVRQLLDQMKSVNSEAWLYEVSACFNEEMGWREEVFNDLMKEYRTLQSAKGWEEDPAKITQMTNLVKDIYSHHKSEGTRGNLVKCKLLISGVSKKIRGASGDSEPPEEIAVLDTLILELEKTMEEL